MRGNQQRRRIGADEIQTVVDAVAIWVSWKIGVMPAFKISV